MRWQTAPGQSAEQEGVFPFTVRYPDDSGKRPGDVRMPIHQTGLYTFILTNCGASSDGVITGSVVVKNPFGFLPGAEYPKLTLYGSLSMFYAFLGAIWMWLSARQFQELTFVHHSIGALIAVGLVEMFMWFLLLNDWNDSGSRATSLTVLATLATTIKKVFFGGLVLVISLGLGYTRPLLDKRVVLKMAGASVGFLFAETTRLTLVTARFERWGIAGGHTLFGFIVILIPALLTGWWLMWSFNELSDLIEKINKGGRSQKLDLFGNLRKLFVGACVATTLNHVAHFFAFRTPLETRWKSEWIYTDAVNQLIFMCTLCGMMFLWAPSRASKLTAYSHHMDVADLEATEAETKGSSAVSAEWTKAEVISTEEEEEMNDEEDSFWANTHGAEDPLVAKAKEGAGEAAHFE